MIRFKVLVNDNEGLGLQDALDIVIKSRGIKKVESGKLDGMPYTEYEPDSRADCRAISGYCNNVRGLLFFDECEVFKIKVAFGSELVSEINDKGEDFDEDDFDGSGEIHHYQYNTEGELKAFVDGLYAMNGWKDYSIL